MRTRTASAGETENAWAESWGPGYELWKWLRALLAQRGPEGTTSLTRMASHIAVVLVVALVLLATHVHLPAWDLAQAGPGAGDADNPPVTALQRGVAPALGALVRAAVPQTLPAAPPPVVANRDLAAAAPPQPRTEITRYTVQAGDTLYGIAEKYGVSAETLMWANNMEANPDLLRLGQELIILPVSGVLHTVQRGDTVDSIARKYKATAADILNLPANGLNGQKTALEAGKQIIVPGGVKPRPVAAPAPIAAAPARSASAPANAPSGNGRFVWPTGGTVTQGYRPLHHALDIGAGWGAPVRASDSGYVAVAGWSNVGYGNYIIIDHRNGYQTLYGHLSRIDVKAGQAVDQGQVIGAVGSTGNSTGPHLHFEIRSGGGTVNPYNFLP